MPARAYNELRPKPLDANANRSFSASYDTSSKVISVVICVVLLAVAIATHNIAVGCLAVVIIFATYAWSPRSYALEDRTIRVHRIAGDAIFPLDDIREARIATPSDVSGAIRLFGNGGVFGYYGLFRTSKLGKCTWYVTNRNNSVVVVTGGKTALFSPDDVDGFLTAIGTAAPIKGVPAPMEARPSGIAGRVFGVAVLLAVAAIIGFALLYAPGPPKYTLTSSALTIHDRFYPVTLDAASVDVAQIRVVDIAQDPDWRPTARTNGFANGHYRSGWFRVANGKTLRLYWADGTRLVLLPPKGAGSPVLLEAADPEELIRDLRRQW